LSTETVQSINSCVTVFSNLGHFGWWRYYIKLLPPANNKIIR
jgi:hypothetical protein